MKNVHIGWGPVGMTKIKTESKQKLKLNKSNYTGNLNSEFKLDIISEFQETPVWQSSNENVAKVDQNGNIMLVGEGTAIITVTSGKLTGKCTIKVVLSKEQQFEKDLQAGKAVLTTSITKTAVVSNKTLLSLNNQILTGDLFTESGGQVLEGNTDSYAIWVKEGGEVTIEGNGEVRSQDARYSMAVWAQGGKVIINGGKFINGGEGSDLIYASAGGQVIINGGEFYPSQKQNGVVGTADKYTALNIKDRDRDTTSIIVYGGKFHNFNPANNQSEGPGTNFVAAGYESVEIEPNVWEVRKIQSALDNTKFYYGTIPTSETFKSFSSLTEEIVIEAITKGTIKSAKLTSTEVQISINKHDVVVILVPGNIYNSGVIDDLTNNKEMFTDSISNTSFHANGEKSLGAFRVFGQYNYTPGTITVYVE